MDIIELTTKIGGIKIFVKMLDTSQSGKIPTPEKINEIIKKEFNTEFDFKTNARRILSELQPFCYEVVVTPPTKGFTYFYSVIAKK